MRVASLFLIAFLAAASSAAADDNCSKVKKSLAKKYDVVKFGLCHHPETVSADRDGMHQCPRVVAGGGRPTESGHRTVENWEEVAPPFPPGAPKVRVPRPHTYLGYCASR
jgi:hypothetical protein